MLSNYICNICYPVVNFSYLSGGFCWCDEQGKLSGSLCLRWTPPDPGRGGMSNDPIATEIKE